MTPGKYRVQKLILVQKLKYINMPVQQEIQDFDSFLTQERHRPIQDIVNALNNNRIPFRKNILLGNNPSKLAAKEWNRCVDFFLDKTPRGTMMDLQNVMAAISEDERPHIEVLETLAVEIVRDMYNVPEDILMRPKIDRPSGEDLEDGDGGEEEEEKEELTAKQKFELEPIIQKRIILNSLMHGAAVHQWVSAFYIGYERLNELNPELIEHYNSYASLINYYNWQHPMALMTENQFNMTFNIGRNGQQQNGGGGMTQGFNKVNIEKQEIDAVGLNFPVLIHELSKGALEYLLARGIPTDLSEEELNYVYDKADKYSHEFWHYYMGPTIWRALILSANIETQNLPSLLAYLSTRDYEDLANLLLKVVNDPEKEGVELMNKIKKQII